jgi:hypothetical protein
MKTVNETLGKIKGEDKINDILTGKGSFSKQGFGDTVNALVNDTTFKIPTYDKNGKKTGDVSVSELIRSDLKKTIDKAKYPQKSEADILDSTDIVTTGLAEAIPHIVMTQIAAGKKFDLPSQPNVNGSIYLADVQGKVKESKVRDMQSKKEVGTVTTTTKDYIQVRAKSPVPSSCVVSKVRKDLNGKVVK